MPIYLIGTAAGSGAAGIAVSQLLAFAAFRAAMPTLLLEVSAESSRPELRTCLFPPKLVRASEVPAVLEQIGSSATVIVAVEATTNADLSTLLPRVDGVVVPGTRLNDDLERAYALYKALSTPQIRGRSGWTLEPWLLAAGWSCTQAPGIRLRGWQQRLAKVAGDDPHRLRCLPLVVPWYERSFLRMESPARLDAVGQRLLQHLDMIAAGLEPERPAAGLAGGDPWPDRAAPIGTPPVPIRPTLWQGA